MHKQIIFNYPLLDIKAQENSWNEEKMYENTASLYHFLAFILAIYHSHAMNSEYMNKIIHYAVCSHIK